jgi:hypothetical protein
MKKLILALALAILSASSFSAMVSEIKVDLRLSGSDFVAGERIRAVVDIANSSPDTISVGYPDSKDSFFLEVFRAGDMTRMTRTSRHPYVAAFQLQSSEGQKLETFIGDHFALRETRRYLVKPVLVHNGVRYEGSFKQGKKHGPFVETDKEGKIIRKGVYKFGILDVSKK